MRLASFRGPDGTPRAGAVVGAAGDERIVDLVEASGGSVPAGDLLALLGAGPRRSLRPAPPPTPARRPAARRRRAPGADPAAGQAAGGRRQLPGAHRRGRRPARRQDQDRPEAVHQALVGDHRAGRGRHAAQRLERPRLGARARHRHRDAWPRHPARQGPRLHRRVLGDQRHLRALDAVGRRRTGAVAASTTSSTGSTASGATASRPSARGSPRPIR